ncbi:hypothetical protein DYB37_011394 [Aphanomyces astaci]|uniref:Folate-Biopterin Transporter (FBT) Family n=2 Tax=Aphanomyces astaci TaxID=112090 RepID=A0A3R6YK65_APHAT|nr:hypothetical protein DYB35_000291 [Aphanomyces astaci]RHZ33653.1 hypothetical protein DYB37_011394 [Aphanomyces astaci]
MRFVNGRDDDNNHGHTSQNHASYDDDYDPLKTPKQQHPFDNNQYNYYDGHGYFEGGAIRPGGPPNYTSPEVLALLSQYVAVGLLYGALPNLAYPLFTAYFHLTGAEYNSATALVSFGWTLKVFVGMLSDCVPICGYRRKSWMIVGWTLCCACMVVLGIKDHGPSYTTLLATNNSALASSSLGDHGAYVAILFAAATVSFIIADVPADALVVEVAQREPVASRGRMQSLIYTTRTVSSIVSQIVIGVCLNSPSYGGTFSWDMGMHALFLMLAVVCALMVPISCVFVQDSRQTGVSFAGYLRQFWDLVQRRATWQVMLFNFFFNLFASGISSTAAPYVKYHWAKVENLGTQLTTIASNLIFAVVLAAMGKWGLDWNWRWVIVLTTLSMNAIDATVQYMTIYDVVRNQWFYLGVPVAEQLPYAMQFIVTTFVIVELAEVGNEGITYGLLTTVSNLPLVFGPVVANVIFGQFKVDNLYIEADSADARTQVAYTYLIYYSTTIFACVWVVLMPSQKAHVHELKVTGGKSPVIGGLVLFGCTAAMLWSVVVGILGVFQSTNCLVIAGGSGC